MAKHSKHLPPPVPSHVSSGPVGHLHACTQKTAHEQNIPLSSSDTALWSVFLPRDTGASPRGPCPRKQPPGGLAGSHSFILLHSALPEMALACGVQSSASRELLSNIHAFSPSLERTGEDMSLSNALTAMVIHRFYVVLLLSEDLLSEKSRHSKCVLLCLSKSVF